MAKRLPDGTANPEAVGLPMRPFLYTLDQIAVLLSMTEQNLRLRYIFFEGRSTGLRSVNEIRAYNIAPRHEKPDWRVSDTELMRWLRHKGFKLYERGSVVE